MDKTLVGYCAPLTCRPGATVRFMVSCERPLAYDVDVVRLICADGFADGAGYEERLVAAGVARGVRGRRQRTAIGSYAVAAEPMLTRDRAAATLAAVIRPTAPGPGLQAIAGTWDAGPGAGALLALAADGTPVLLLGDGQGGRLTVAADRAATPDRWSLVVAGFDVERGIARIWHRPVGGGPDAAFRPPGRGTARLDIAPAPARAGPFMIAAHRGADGHPAGHFNGRIEAVRLLARALGEGELDRLADVAIPGDLARDVVAWWDFGRDIASRTLVDLSPLAAHARTENLPNRAVPGHRWTGECHDWRAAPDQYAAVHFHADDIYDAGWQADFAWQVPTGLPSGVYAARLDAGDEVEHVPFFVPPPAGTATADVAFLASTATYLAYANIRTLLTRDPPFGIRTPNEAMLAARPEFGHSTYDRHADGSGVHYSSPHRPILNLKPRSYRWGFTADMNVVAWLARCGHAHDVVTDDQLHAEGADLLRRYRVVVTGTHPEYFSTAMRDAVEGYLGAGGRLMYLGGNGFYWRIACSDEWPGAIEVRRAEGGTRPWIAEPGAYRHALGG
ncbi:MAG: N,N-dimethylformamidase large subunit, partial [Alphaproteobacteria bacterium]|nr:N,N-dimethylformamidase large subunit [Alphaproteobacteria bacterium]